MTTSPTILDSDFKYIDKKGNLLKTRTELTVAQMLTFLENEYQYNYEISLKNGTKVKVDFKTEKGLIEVIDNDEDIQKYRQIKEDFPEEKIMAIGHAKYTAQIKELQDIVFYEKTPQTGSIFLDDASFAFDYAHILPLVEKCSILHGHTSSVMVELVGQMKNNLLVDFGIAKKIIKKWLMNLIINFSLIKNILKKKMKHIMKLVLKDQKECLIYKFQNIQHIYLKEKLQLKISQVK